MRTRTVLLPILALLVSAAPAAQAEEGAIDFTFGTGVFYSSGDYGFEDETRIIEVPFEAILTTGRFTFSAEVPWLHADGPADAANATRFGDAATRFPRLASLRDPAEDPSVVSGLGDASFAATARLTPDGSPLWAGLTLMATAPTGDEDEGLGTGASDLSADLALERTLGDFTVHGAAGYVWPGETDAPPPVLQPADLIISDYAFASFGAQYLTLSGQSFGAGAAWTEAASPDTEDVVEVSLSWAFPVSTGVRMGTYVAKGMAGDGSDVSAGLRLTFAANN